MTSLAWTNPPDSCWDYLLAIHISIATQQQSVPDFEKEAACLSMNSVQSIHFQFTLQIKSRFLLMESYNKGLYYYYYFYYYYYYYVYCNDTRVFVKQLQFSTSTNNIMILILLIIITVIIVIMIMIMMIITMVV